METRNGAAGPRVPWNKDKLAGQKPRLKLPEIWVVRTRLQMSSHIRELAMFNLAIGNKLRACDLTRLLVQEVCQGSYVGLRAMVMQQKTQRRVQFETTDQTGQSIKAWIKARNLKPTDYLFPSRLRASPHISTRQYARLVHRWIASIGLDDTAYGTHTMRLTKTSIIYRRMEPSRGAVTTWPYQARLSPAQDYVQCSLGIPMR